MENQNQHYGTHESMYVEDPNNEKEFLHSEDDEKPEVTGDPSETAEDHDLNPDTKNVGEADVDSLLKAIDNPDPDDDDEDDDDDDDFDLDDDDDLPIEPDGDDLDDEKLDDDDEEETYLK